MNNCASAAGADGIRPIKYSDGVLKLIDQRRLPTEEVWLEYREAASVAEAIRSMVVRGAPAIGVTAAYGAFFGARDIKAGDHAGFMQAFADVCDQLAATRPTAVNLFWALDRMKSLVQANPDQPVENLKIGLEYEAMAIHDEDIRINMSMGKHGAALLPDQVRILTHCNAGALATAGYGTALGVVRAAVAAGKNVTVFADETRPFLQGARLTAWELQKDGIPTILICDNMAGALMAKGVIDAVIVGADRVAANGDVANKIGTYSVAVLAKEHGIPFYVAAPTSTIDLAIPEGSQIPIEERASQEVTHMGGQQVAPEGIAVLNPAFDMTPARYVSAIITEFGVAEGHYQEQLAALTKRGRA
jgi:methylthioribose-1-phosphate isomerase